MYLYVASWRKSQNNCVLGCHFVHVVTDIFANSYLQTSFGLQYFPCWKTTSPQHGSTTTM